MNTTDTSIAQGDQVRSFDFDYNRDLEGPRACYVEGVVEAIGPFSTVDGISRYDAYTIRVTRRVFAGEEIATGEETIYAPVNGTGKSTGGVCNGVERILSAAHLAELQNALTSELVAIHNVYTMGATCLQVGDTTRAAAVLAKTDEILAARGVEIVTGELLRAPAPQAELFELTRRLYEAKKPACTCGWNDDSGAHDQGCDLARSWDYAADEAEQDMHDRGLLPL